MSSSRWNPIRIHRSAELRAVGHARVRPQACRGCVRWGQPQVSVFPRDQGNRLENVGSRLQGGSRHRFWADLRRRPESIMASAAGCRRRRFEPADIDPIDDDRHVRAGLEDRTGPGTGRGRIGGQLNMAIDQVGDPLRHNAARGVDAGHPRRSVLEPWWSHFLAPAPIGRPAAGLNSE
jgi:hypothetical protein